MPVAAYQSLDFAAWTVRAVDLSGVPAEIGARAVPAAVPGCIHTDLMDAGLIPNVCIGDAELRIQWVSWTDWRYECALEADPRLFDHPEIDLVFDCLDTIATIELNGAKVGDAASEFIPHRFDVRGVLQPGANTLAVTFKSPLRHIHEEAARLSPRPVNGDWDPYIFIRKCASNFGWDWGPKVATCGITQSVRLETLADGPRWTPSPPYWGSQGRTIEFDPATFALRINGERTPIRGANWIPEGLWPRDRTPERIRQRLQQLKDANMNMLRVWGGGRYEPDWFYDLCDELGILVWQDFMFSCACYPEEEPIRSLVEAEARHQVARLSRHPCVVIWCGGNENHWAYESWGFKEKLKPGQTWGRYYWNDLLPRIVADLSSGTPYIPNSPWSGDGAHANDPTRGDHHTWDIKLPSDYRKLTPPFVSEFGWQSPSMPNTLCEAGITPPPCGRGPGEGLENATDSINTPPLPPELLRRQRGLGGMQRWFDDPMRDLDLRPRSFNEWCDAAHDLQARYLAAYVAWLLANPDRCSGFLIWQLNDAWPGLSWSLIDSAGREKPAYHAVRRALDPAKTQRPGA